MDTIEAIHRRRSIRVYTAEVVERSLLEDLLWAAVQAPTPPVSGAAPWHIAVIEGATRLRDYGARAKQYAFEHQRSEWATRPGFEAFWNAPSAVLFSARTGHPEAAQDCCRATQTFIIAATAAGLGSCWVGAPLPWLRDAEVQRELGLPEGYQVFDVVLVGHPAEQPGGSPRPRPQLQWLN